MNERRSLLSSSVLVQAPWIKVTIGAYTFGVFSKSSASPKDADGFYNACKVQFPNFIQSLNIVKINGQVNTYTLNIKYPVRPQDDPNFFEKVFSSVSKTRKIVFSYGDSSMPTYCYKDEEAIITKISTSFNFGSGGSSLEAVIGYTITAVSSAALGKAGAFTFLNSGKKKPSEEIKRIFKNRQYGLQDIFTGMKVKDLDTFIDGSDKAVELSSKVNISPLDYIIYLASCMVPETSSIGQTSKDIYILTLHDDTIYDQQVEEIKDITGPYFKVTRTSYAKSQSDAYELDVGFNTRVAISNFSVDNQENYSLYYDYSNKLYEDEYVKRINDSGKWEDVFAPVMTSKNESHRTKAEDIAWYTKITQYPISASITVQGLLRPAMLMQYLRLNVIFPGGIGTSGDRKHISSGLYLITKQVDDISGNGWKTTLSLQKISGDDLGAN